MAQRVTIRVTPDDAVLLARIRKAAPAKTQTETIRHAFRFAVAFLEGWTHSDVLEAHERASKKAHQSLLAVERRRRSERSQQRMHTGESYRLEVARLSKELVAAQDYIKELEEGVLNRVQTESCIEPGIDA